MSYAETSSIAPSPGIIEKIHSSLNELENVHSELIDRIENVYGSLLRKKEPTDPPPPGSGALRDVHSRIERALAIATHVLEITRQA